MKLNLNSTPPGGFTLYDYPGSEGRAGRVAPPHDRTADIPVSRFADFPVGPANKAKLALAAFRRPAGWKARDTAARNVCATLSPDALSVLLPSTAGRWLPGLALALALALALVVLAGCTAGPNYQAPKIAAPAQWQAPLAGGETNPAPAVVAWWRLFHDPQLDSLMDRAVSSNLDLRIAGARVREARAQYQTVAADLQPTVETSGSYARQRQSQHQPLIGSLPLPAGVPFENNVYQAGFDAAWEMDVFGGTRRAVEAGRAEVAAAEFGRRNTLVTLLAEVGRNYAALRGHQRRLAIANENIQAEEEVLAIARDRFQHGLTSELDVQQAATLLATTRAEIPTLATLIQTAIHRLGVLVARPPGALAEELSPTAPLPVGPPEVPVGLPSDLLLRRPDIRQAERALAAATAGIGVARADLFPKFSLTGAAGLQSVSTGDWFTAGSRFWSVGPTVQWRIFDAGRIRANIRVQDARQEQALALYEQTVLTAFEEVEDALVAYAQEQVRRRSLTEALASSRDSLHLARQLYDHGLTGFINVLEAERSLHQAEDALAQSDQAVTQQLIALYKALGGGWEIEKCPGADRPPTEAVPPV
jgi:NodT family efflux transporter outer membrane factor (OMF) lipoprotein